METYLLRSGSEKCRHLEHKPQAKRAKGSTRYWQTTSNGPAGFKKPHSSLTASAPLPLETFILGIAYLSIHALWWRMTGWQLQSNMSESVIGEFYEK